MCLANGKGDMEVPRGVSEAFSFWLRFMIVQYCVMITKCSLSPVR